MLSLPALMAFLPVAALIVAVPGPSVLFTIGRALSVGRRPALLTVLGNGAGLAVQVAVIAVGLGAVLARVSWALTGLKVVGGCYLIWLGLVSLHRRGQHQDSADVTVVASSAWVDLRAGFILGVTNPKTLVFLAALLPQFVPETASWTAQMAMLGLAFSLVAIAGDSIWALTAAHARTWLGRSAKRMERVRGAGGLMLVGLGTYTLVSHETAR